MNIDNLELKKLIKGLCEAMKADFGNQYSKQFANDRELAQYQRRVYQKFDGSNIADLADGYEDYVNSHHSFPPNLSQLIEYADKAKALRKAHEKKQEQIIQDTFRIEHKHTIECNPIEMLADAKGKTNKNDDDISTEERAKRLAEMMANHNAVLKINGSLLRKPKYDTNNYRCDYHGCHTTGAISDSTRGEGPWYCREHHRMV